MLGMQFQETPSRIMRRIAAAEEDELPTLPSPIRSDDSLDDSISPSVLQPRRILTPLNLNAAIRSPSVDIKSSPYSSTPQSNPSKTINIPLPNSAVSSAATTVRQHRVGSAARNTSLSREVRFDDSSESIQEEEHFPSHVAVRRKTGPIKRPSHVASPNTTVESPATPAKNESYLSSPGQARHVSPNLSRVNGQYRVQDRLLSQTPASKTVSDFATVTRADAHSSPDLLATPRPAGNDADIERRKSHLLSVLRLTAVRSAAGSRLKKGTPFPRRSFTASTISENEEAARSADADSEVSDTTSHDLTTHPRANNSLPLGDQANRFNGTKLNTYLHNLNTHLTEENQNLVTKLAQTAKELQRTRRSNARLAERHGDVTMASEDMSIDCEDDLDRSVASHVETQSAIIKLRQHLIPSSPDPSVSSQVRDLQQQVELLQTGIEERDHAITAMRKEVLEQHSSSDSADHAATLQREVYSLQDRLSTLDNLQVEKDQRIENLESQAIESAQRHASIVADLQARSDELLQQLEERDAELQQMHDEMQGQEAGFVEKMKNLEDELVNVMEEQEEQLQATREELASQKGESLRYRQAEGAQFELTKTQLADLRIEMEAVKAEKMRLENLLDQVEADDGDKSVITNGRLELLKEELERLTVTVADKESQISTLNGQLATVAEDHAAITAKLKAQLSAAEDGLTKMEDSLHEARLENAELHQKADEAKSAAQDAQEALASVNDELQQAIRDKSRQDTAIAEMQGQLAEASTSLRNASTTSSERQARISQLIFDLEASKREISRLKKQLASVPSPTTPRQGLPSNSPTVKAIKTYKAELETRVSELKRHHASFIVTPDGTPNKSLHFKTLQSIQTPKTPGHFLNDKSWWQQSTPTPSNGNQTISPLLSQIDELEAQIAALQAQLDFANEGVDDKIERLEAIGMNTIGLGKALEAARERIVELEDELDEAISAREGNEKDRAVIERLRKDLEAERRRAQQFGESEQAAQQRVITSAKDNQHLRARVEKFSLLSEELKLSEMTIDRLNDHIHKLQDEKACMLRDVGDLGADLKRVRANAHNLGEDLVILQKGQSAASEAVCQRAECVGAFEKHKEEAKGLLVMIKYLRARCSREATFKADLIQQKTFLGIAASEDRTKLKAITNTLVRFGLPTLDAQPSRECICSSRFKTGAKAVLAVVRLQRLSREWRDQEGLKVAVREAYSKVRGKPFSPPAEL